MSIWNFKIFDLYRQNYQDMWSIFWAEHVRLSFYRHSIPSLPQTFPLEESLKTLLPFHVGSLGITIFSNILLMFLTRKKSNWIFFEGEFIIFFHRRKRKTTHWCVNPPPFIAPVRFGADEGSVEQMEKWFISPSCVWRCICLCNYTCT